jgi:hypothetical protein
MIRNLIRKPIDGSDKPSSEKRFQELVREYKRKAENSEKKGKEVTPAHTPEFDKLV